MSFARRTSILAVGAVAGVVASAPMTLVAAVLRERLGVASVPEMIGDRTVTRLKLGTFLKLMDRAGGPVQLKKLGAASVLVGQVLAGALGGVAHALIAERRGGSRWRTRPPGLVTLELGAVAAIWLALLAIVRPWLPSHYLGLPPRRASAASATSLLLSMTSYWLSLRAAYAAIIRRQAGAEPRASVRGAAAVVAGAATITIACALFLRRLYQRATFSYDGMLYVGPDVQPQTPTDRFYTVSKNLVDPNVAASLWRLEIGGTVKQSASYRFAEIAALPSVTQETTLACISNPVGGGLMSNATWRGVRLRDLLGAAGPAAGVRQVILRGVDGFTDTIPFDKAMEPATLIIYEMNGAPLPDRHGFPVRLIVPGLVGEKSVKWLTRIELTKDEAQGYYEQAGWGPDFTLPISARFDAPNVEQPFRAGAAVELKGVAFGADRGVSRVEVSTDGGGSWQEAQITYPGARLTWAFWRAEWSPSAPGEYQLVVRATDGAGSTQISAERPSAPESATGYHRLTARVEA